MELPTVLSGMRLMSGIFRNWLFVKIETDEGLHGWGEASLELKEKTVEQAIHQYADWIIGQDPTRIEHLWQILYRHSFWRGGVVLNTALSGIDQALWDITGKAYGQPVYKLLGGARDRVKAYASTCPNIGSPDVYAEHALACKKEGYLAYKIHPHYSKI